MHPNHGRDASESAGSEHEADSNLTPTIDFEIPDIYQRKDEKDDVLDDGAD